MGWPAVEKILQVLTGEKHLEGQANGGTVIFLRTLRITILVYVAAFMVKSLLNTGFGWQFDYKVIRETIDETLPWLGAIFGGTYLALYSRFSSQWTYLAATYNQLMAAQVQAPLNEKDDSERRRAYTTWKAGILEDAYDLHLATKKMFAPLTADFLEDEEVLAAFMKTTVNGDQRVQLLERRLSEVLKRTVQAGSKRRNSAVATTQHPIKLNSPTANDPIKNADV